MKLRIMLPYLMENGLMDVVDMAVSQEVAFTGDIISIAHKYGDYDLINVQPQRESFRLIVTSKTGRNYD